MVNHTGYINLAGRWGITLLSLVEPVPLKLEASLSFLVRVALFFHRRKYLYFTASSKKITDNFINLNYLKIKKVLFSLKLAYVCVVPLYMNSYTGFF